MQNDVDYFLARDPIINDLSDKINYAVKKGASQFSAQRFVANSQSASQISFNITPPSESTVIDRHILLRSTVNFTLSLGSAATGAQIPANKSVWEYGDRFSLQAFPLNKLFQTVTASVNNTSISVNQADVMPGLLQLLDKEDLQRWNGMTPAFLDQYQRYSQASAVTSNGDKPTNNPMASYRGDGYNNKLNPRGCHPITITGATRFVTGAPPVESDNLRSSGLDDWWVINCRVTLCEPLFVSPMIFGDSKFNRAGFLGVNNFNLNFNVDSSMKRFFSCAYADATPFSIAFGANAFENSEILMNFLSLDQTVSVPSKICLPIMDYPRYLTSSNVAALAVGAENQYSVNSIQLDKIPDKIIVYARKSLATQTAKDSDSFLPIKAVTVTFANSSGLLSNHTQQQLWEISRKNGNKQSWYEWSGESNGYIDPGAVDQTFAQVNAAQYVPTTGGVLVLDPAYDLSLQGPYLSDGSLGAFQVQMTLTLKNTYTAPVAPEIVVITANSGVLTTVAGNSSLYSGLVNMQVAMETIQKDGSRAVSMDGEDDRLIGGMKGSAMSAGSKSAGARSAGKSVRGKLDMLSM